MDNNNTILRKLSSVLGSSAIFLGAFGAHALQNKLTPKQLSNWRTAVSYQLFHAVALLALSAEVKQQSTTSITMTEKDKQVSNQPQSMQAGKMMALGCIMFSGSIYALCLDIGPKKLLGPVTPIGGLIMMSGWIWYGVA